MRGRGRLVSLRSMLLALLLACSNPAPPPVRRNAVVILVDTLREDALRKARMPNVNGIGQRGDVAFGWSSGTWTVPSVIALFTGRPVGSHGWDLPTGRMGKYPQLPATPTLAEVLDEAGFNTVGLYANPYLAEELGFSRGFDVWKRVSDRGMPKDFAKAIAETWKPEGQNFAYLHLIGPHSPLRPSDAAKARYKLEERWFADPKHPLEVGAPQRKDKPGIDVAYRDAYYAVCEDVDGIVGELLSALGPYRDDTLILLTADHGELLGEHALFGHGTQVWEPLTRVPMLAENAGELPARMGTASIAAFVTRGVGVAHTWPTAVEVPTLVSQREGKLAITEDGRTKLIIDGGERLYDLGVDPGELSPRGDAAAAKALRDSYAAWRPPALTMGEEATLDAPTLEKVRELGYVE